MTRFHFLGVCAALTLLSGCAQQIWYQPGATVSSVRQAQDACDLQALEAAPYRAQTRIVPGRIIPETKSCDAQGNCQIIPAQQGFPEFETVDGNEDRRALLARTCMAKAGFQTVSLPTCSAAQRKSVAAGVTRTLPQISEQSCIIPRGTAGYQIVTP